jgi:lysophospholipase L1-like esterase
MHILSSFVTSWRTLAVISVVLTFACRVPAQDESPGPDPAYRPTVGTLDLSDGDSFVFLGDSITHQCLYTQYVEDFFYTHFPNRRIHFHNAGVGGDRAVDALIRFDDDVAAAKPKYVTILLGMNDGRYTKFDDDIFATYRGDMAKVLDRIAAIGATAIPMTPTMFDSRAAKMRDAGRADNEVRDEFYNGVLALYGAWLREQALLRGLGFVDMHSPLNQLSMRHRASDPKFTLIEDAVHPGPNGQVVMATALLQDLGMGSPVSMLTVDRRRDGWHVHSTDGEVQNQSTGDSLRFSFTAERLPWVLPPEAALGVDLTHAGRFGFERLRVVGLEPGKYQLKIDDSVVGEFFAGALARGVDLQDNPQTPQYQQALRVALLNKQRNDEAVRPLRGQWGARKGRRYAIENAENDQQRGSREAELQAWLPDFEQAVAGFKKAAAEYEDQIYQASQPRPHTYELLQR